MSIFKKTQEDKNYALGKAIIKGDTKGVKNAIENGACLTDKRIPYNYSDGCYSRADISYIFECGLRNNNAEPAKIKEIFKLMLDAGFPRESQRGTLLHDVCYSSYLCACPGLVAMLVEQYNFDVCALNGSDISPFDYALSSDLDVAKYLLSLGSVGPESASNVIEQGRSSLLSQIIAVVEGAEAHGAKNPAVEYVRENALRTAINQGSMNDFNYLMSLKEMDFSYAFGGGSSNFLTEVAMTEGNAAVRAKMAKSLLAAGVPIEGSALPHFCTFSPTITGVEDIISAILEKGKEQGITDKLGLDLAAQQAIQHDKNQKILSLLLDAGADIEAEDPARSRETLLIAAVRRCDIETVEFLISRGADTKKWNSAGITAYDMAITKMQEITKDSQDDNTRRTLVLYARIRNLVSLDAPPAVPKATQSAVVAEDDIYRMPNKMSLEINQGGGLTMTFNFWTQQVIYRDAAGGMNVQPFDEIQRQAAITEACEKLKEMGGTPPELDVIDTPGKRRTGLGGLTSGVK